MVELAQDTYMINTLIVVNFEIVRQVNTDMHMFDLIKVPWFDIESLAFVLFRTFYDDYYLVNIKTCARPQLLVKANTRKPGVFIPSGKDSFEFHFAHVVTDDDKSQHEEHHRLQWTKDMVDYLKKNG